MEEKRPLLSKELKEKITKLMPLIITIFVITMIALSFIGNFYEVRLKVDGVKTDSYCTFSDLLFNNPAGAGIQAFYIIVYLILPIIACILLFFIRFNNNIAVISLLLFLMSAITSIVSKDAFIYVLSEGFSTNYSIHDIYFPSILPTITFFVSSLLVLSLATNQMEFNVGDITEMGVLVALALGLNFIKVLQFPTGGSVNLQMLPLFLLTLRRGPLKGFIGGGIIYGLISCLTDGYGFAFYPFDYLMAFGSSCLLGFFVPYIMSESQKTYNIKGEVFLLVGAILATFFRFVGGCISSMIFYSYSLVAAMEYNALYVFVSGGIAIAVIMALYGPILRVHHYFPTNKREELPEE